MSNFFDLEAGGAIRDERDYWFTPLTPKTTHSHPPNPFYIPTFLTG